MRFNQCLIRISEWVREVVDSMWKAAVLVNQCGIHSKGVWICGIEREWAAWRQKEVEGPWERTRIMLEGIWNEASGKRVVLGR